MSKSWSYYCGVVVTLPIASTTTVNVPTVALLLLDVPVTFAYVPGVLFTLSTCNVTSETPPLPNTLSLTVIISPIACPVPGLLY